MYFSLIKKYDEYDIGEMAEPDMKKMTDEFLKFADVKIKN